MEIERKYRIFNPPADYRSYPHQLLEQAYLCTDPVVRIRKEDDTCYLTYKSMGLLAREEYNLPLTAKAYEHLLSKADGIVLKKIRYRIPIEDTKLTIELDEFLSDYQGLMLAEVEFPTVNDAESFTAPSWFGPDVTMTGEFQNSRLSREKAAY